MFSVTCRVSTIALLVLALGHSMSLAGGDVRQPSVPELLKREISPEGVAYLQKLRKERIPFGTNDFNLAALRAGMGSRREPTIKDVKLIKVKVGDVPCEWVVAPGADPDLRLLYIHGGGFVSGSGAYYLKMAAQISAAAGCAVLLPDYRLAPEHPFPAGLDDCVRAHEWMRANGPTGPAPARATFVAGDSAGGSLTLTTILALRDRKLPLPAAGIAISPCTDFTLTSESIKTVHDPIISAKTMPVFRDHYLGKTDPRDPLVSPVFGDYRGLPPLLFQIGEHEMLRDDGIRAARKARADGAAVKLEVWPGMFHVFQSHDIPEARAAIAHMGDFIRATSPKSELAKLAASMKPGTWAELKTDNYSAELLRVQNGNILGYTDTAVWDPKSQQVLFVGQGHYAAVKFITYAAASNAWKLMPTPVWWDGDPKSGKGPIGHAYQNNTIDTARGIFFHHQSATRLVHRYDIANDKWSTLPEIKGAATGHGTALAYFPERKGLVRIYGGAVHIFEEEKNTWSLLKERFPMGPYHNIAKYNAVDKSVIFGAGNGSKVLHRMDAQGNVTPLKEAPFVIRISSTVTAIDPVSGDFLVISSEDKGKFHALDVKKNEWRPLPDAPIFEGASASIDRYGVTLYFSNRPTKVYLYKHAK